MAGGCTPTPVSFALASLYVGAAGLVAHGPCALGRVGRRGPERPLSRAPVVAPGLPGHPREMVKTLSDICRYGTPGSVTMGVSDASVELSVSISRRFRNRLPKVQKASEPLASEICSKGFHQPDFAERFRFHPAASAHRMGLWRSSWA